MEALRHSSDFAPALARLAEVYRRLDGTPERALEAIRRARKLERSRFRYRLREAQILVESGARDQALEIAAKLVSDAVETDSASYNNSVCWDGSLWGLAEAVLPACERAVELRPESYGILDSRAVARVLSGDLEGALDDFRKCLQLAGDRWSEEVRSKRTAWVQALERGERPFAGAEVLLEDPEETNLGWGS